VLHGRRFRNLHKASNYHFASRQDAAAKILSRARCATEPGIKAQEADIGAERARDRDALRKAVAAFSIENQGGSKMSRESDNKAIVGRWFEGFWGNPWNPRIIDEVAAPDMLLQYSLHKPRRGRDDVRAFMEGFRAAFPDLNFWGAAELIAEGDYVVGRWEGGGTHSGPPFDDFLIGALPAGSGRKMRFTGTTVLRVANGMIAEEIGLDDGVTALQQLGILKAA
jgi:predicted ester cyclase